MAVTRCFALLATSAFMVTMILHTADGAGTTITCYACSGTSGTPFPLPASYFRNCGLPFNDNTTSAASRLPTVTCEGVCVTNTVYTAGQQTTDIYRSCSDAPVTDGCEYSVTTAGFQQWSCIKTCKDKDNCNDSSDSTMLTPPAVIRLLVLSIVAVVMRSMLF